MNIFRIAWIIMTVLLFSHKSYANDKYDWMNSDIQSMESTVAECVSPPEFAKVKNIKSTLNISKSGEWVSTESYVLKDRSLAINWSSDKIRYSTEKYKVLFRIDPRFRKPQVFIQKYSQHELKYISDFHRYKNGRLLKYQNNELLDYYSRIRDFVEYFDFREREKIYVRNGDVVNITLDKDKNYFSGDSEMNTELSSYKDNLMLIYTNNNIEDNKIIYTNTDQWCNNIVTTDADDYADYCIPYTHNYSDIQDNFNTLTGIVNPRHLFKQRDNLTSCADNAIGRNNDPVCYYDKGRGMLIKIGANVIKPMEKQFGYSPLSKYHFLYYQSKTSGALEFDTQWPIEGMYDSQIQFMSHYMQYQGKKINDQNQLQYLIKSYNEMQMNFLHFGRYLLYVEVGRTSKVSRADIDNVRVEYTIVQEGRPSESTIGKIVDKQLHTNAEKSGYLWLRVVNDNKDLEGSIDVDISHYYGSTWFSDIIYGSLIQPLREKFSTLSKTVYMNLVNNVILYNIARSGLVVYIMIYSLMFLTGSTEIKVNDIFIRFGKIGLIVVLFSERSWSFFNDYLFNLFTQGSEYLMSGLFISTGKAGNIFGFIDPIFDRYTNPKVWQLLLIQLLQIQNGLSFFAAMSIYSIIIYLIAVIEVIVTYCLAFLGIAVMLSLAPLFIMFILFERTKSIFDNWISTLFSYVIQPSILLLFFLLIEQIIGEQLSKIVVKACWGSLIPIDISLDLSHIGVEKTFSLKLPFFPYIPFYIPETSPNTLATVITSSLIMWSMCRLAKGVVDYTNLVTKFLTNVLPARQYGKRQKSNSLTHAIMNDFKYGASRISKPLVSFGRRAFTGSQVNRVGSTNDSQLKKQSSDDVDQQNSRKNIGINRDKSGDLVDSQSNADKDKSRDALDKIRLDDINQSYNKGEGDATQERSDSGIDSIDELEVDSTMNNKTDDQSYNKGEGDATQERSDRNIDSIDESTVDLTMNNKTDKKTE